MESDGIKSIGVIHNFLINVEGYSPDMLMQLQDLISDFLEDLFEMKGAFVITRGIKRITDLFQINQRFLENYRNS